MRRSLTVGVLSACLHVLACTPEIFPCVGGSGAAVPPEPDKSEPIGVVGEPMTVVLSVGVFASCTGARLADSVVTEVVGPDNRKLDHTDMVRRDGSLSNDVSVTFTPTMRGPHHLSARFEPNLGQVQRDIWVATDRRDAGMAVARYEGACDSYALTDHLSVGCLRSDTLTFTQTDGGVLASIDSTQLGRYSVNGDVIWYWDFTDRTLHRLTDEGTAPARDERFSCAGVDDAVGVVAGVDSLLVVGSFRASAVSMVSGSCEVRSTWSLESSYPGWAAWNGSAGVVAQSSAGVSRLTADGGTSRLGPSLEPVHAAGPDGLWGVTSGQVTLYGFGTEPSVEPIPRGWTPLNFEPVGVVPVLSNLSNDQWHVLARTADGFELQRWSTTFGRPKQVLPHHVVTVNGTSARFFQR